MAGATSNPRRRVRAVLGMIQDILLPPQISRFLLRFPLRKSLFFLLVADSGDYTVLHPIESVKMGRLSSFNHGTTAVMRGFFGVLPAAKQRQVPWGIIPLEYRAPFFSCKGPIDGECFRDADLNKSTLQVTH